MLSCIDYIITGTDLAFHYFIFYSVEYNYFSTILCHYSISIPILLYID